MEFMTSGTMVVIAVECHLFIARVVYSPVFVVHVYVLKADSLLFIHGRMVVLLI